METNERVAAWTFLVFLASPFYPVPLEKNLKTTTTTTTMTTTTTTTTTTTLWTLRKTARTVTSPKQQVWSLIRGTVHSPSHPKSDDSFLHVIFMLYHPKTPIYPFSCTYQTWVCVHQRFQSTEVAAEEALVRRTGILCIAPKYRFRQYHTFRVYMWSDSHRHLFICEIQQQTIFGICN